MTKLEILADAAKYDASCASSGSRRARKPNGIGNTEGMGICHSYTPDGRCISLLKILMTNVCIWDCAYCVNRRSSDVRRARFKPEEIVNLTLDFYKRNYIEGLFLSSGIIQNADYTMENLVLVAKKLREQDFGGYIHLKAVPGASPELLTEAGVYADRLSANIELPVQKDLDELAPEKSISEIEETMAVIRDGITANSDLKKKNGETPKFARAGQSTQLVVGATASNDKTILIKAEQLYQSFNLRRVYYSAFSPIAGTDERIITKAAPLVREHRLYQADWLIRFYGFKTGEIFSNAATGDLDLEIDPKLAWALRHRDIFPVDVNTAPRSRLMRVPGLGAKNADRIIKIRRHKKISLEDLARLRVRLSSARWFVVTADHRPKDVEDVLSFLKPKKPKSFQPGLFDGPNLNGVAE